jgi:ATP-binding cassette subfamily F protein 3
VKSTSGKIEIIISRFSQLLRSVILMIVLACSNISLSYGPESILDNVSFSIQQSEKVSLIGVNGAGKSSLFKIISGHLQQDSGEVFLGKNHTIGYLEQNINPAYDKTLWEEIISAYSHLISLEKKIRQLEAEISLESNKDSLASLMKEYDRLTEKYKREGGFEYISRAKGVLRGLGFSEEQYGLSAASLSGGQKTRLTLARLLLEEPDILLLDEPTNHLDIDSMEWLEDFLKNYKKSAFIISHDRYFLDAVTEKTIELETGKCKLYPGNYSTYAVQKAEDRKIQQKHYNQQQKEIARMEAFIEQQRQWNRQRNIIAAESRQKAIDRMEKVQAPDKLPDKINFRLKTNKTGGKDVLSVSELSMAFPDKPLFDNFDFEIKRNEKVFLMGPNGCGKSTLLKILVGKIPPSSGSFKFGSNIELGYYDQELQDLNRDNTVLEEVWTDNDNYTHTEIRNTLAGFLFTGEDVFKQISILSGGEKSRVSLVKLMLSGANFLILDEPTNHLDINTREILEEALINFDGTILAVSHDRYFIKKLANRILEMTPSGLLDFIGDYEYYLNYKKSIRANDDTEGCNTQQQSASKLQRLEIKKERARVRKLERTRDEAEKQIAETESAINDIEKQMSDEAISSDHVALSNLLSEHQSLKDKLDKLYQIWADCSTQLEEYE